MIEKIGPTIYKGGTIYNIGAGGGGGNVLLTPPENVVFLEYYIQSYNSGGYFAWTDDIFRIEKTDIVYFKFSANIYGQPAFKLCEAVGDNSAEMELKTDNWPSQNGGNITFKDYNISTTRVTSQNIPVQNAEVLYSVKRTSSGWDFNGNFISHSSNRSWVGIVRYYLVQSGNNVNIKVYKTVVTDLDGNIKYQIIPAKNTQTNLIGVYCPEKDILLHPNTQGGFSAGPEVYY